MDSILQPVFSLPVMPGPAPQNEAELRRRRDKEFYDDAGFLLPHHRTFTGIINNVSRLHSFRFDEAMRHAPANAIAMRHDAYFSALIDERTTPLMRWPMQVEIDADDANKADSQGGKQEEIRKQLESIVRNTWALAHMREYLREFVWVGKQGAQVAWGEKQIGGHRRRVIVRHAPVDGDKILTDFDGHPAIAIYGGDVDKFPADSLGRSGGEAKGVIAYSDRFPVLKLNRPDYRQRFIIPIYRMRDGDYFDPYSAGRIGGIGLRHYAYWAWWLRDEMLAWATDFMEKVGSLGVMMFYYEEHNVEGKARAVAAARQVGNGNALAVPVPRGDKRSGSVELIPANMTGVQFLTDFIGNYFEGHLERLIVGQKLSANTEGHGLGGSGVAGFQMDTKYQLLASDAELMSWCLTQDLLGPAVQLNFPGCPWNYRIKLVVPQPDSEKKLQAVSSAWSLGVDFAEDEVRELTGLTKPQEGERTLRQIATEQKQEDQARDIQRSILWNHPASLANAPELMSAMLHLGQNGEHEAAGKLADLAKDPKQMAAMLGESGGEQLPQGPPAAEVPHVTHGDESQQEYHYAWVSAQTRKGGIKAIGVSEHQGQVLYGEKAKQALAGSRPTSLTAETAQGPGKKAKPEGEEQKPKTPEERYARADEIILNAAHGRSNPDEVEELAKSLPKFSAKQIKKLADGLIQSSMAKQRPVKKDVVAHLVNWARNMVKNHDEYAQSRVAQKSEDSIRDGRSLGSQESAGAGETGIGRSVDGIDDQSGDADASDTKNDVDGKHEVYDRFQDALHSATHIKPGQRAHYQRNLNAVLDIMPKAAHDKIAGHVSSIGFHEKPEDIGRATVDALLMDSGSATPKNKAKLAALIKGIYGDEKGKRRIKPGASWLPKQGGIHLDGDIGENYDAQQVYAHALGHAMDGPDKHISGSAAWQKAWKEEIAGGGLTKYAGKSAHEGLAEFSRLVYGGQHMPQHVEKAYPQASAALKASGVWPEAEQHNWKQDKKTGKWERFTPEVIDQDKLGKADTELEDATPIEQPKDEAIQDVAISPGGESEPTEVVGEPQNPILAELFQGRIGLDDEPGGAHVDAVEYEHPPGKLFDDGETNERLGHLERLAISHGVLPELGIYRHGTDDFREQQLHDAIMAATAKANPDYEPDSLEPSDIPGHLPKSLRDFSASHHERLAKLEDDRRRKEEDQAEADRQKKAASERGFYHDGETAFAAHPEHIDKAEEVAKELADGIKSAEDRLTNEPMTPRQKSKLKKSIQDAKGDHAKMRGGIEKARGKKELPEIEYESDLQRDLHQLAMKMREGGDRTGESSSGSTSATRPHGESEFQQLLNSLKQQTGLSENDIRELAGKVKEDVSEQSRHAKKGEKLKVKDNHGIAKMAKPKAAQSETETVPPPEDIEPKPELQQDQYDHPAIEKHAQSLLAAAIKKAKADGRETEITPELTNSALERFRNLARETYGSMIDKESLYKRWKRGALHPSNRQTRQMFQDVHGVTLPATVSGTNAAVRAHLGEEFVSGKEAEKQAEIDREAKEKADKKATEYQAKLDKFSGFGAGMMPLARSQAHKSLERSFQFGQGAEGKPLHEHIREKIEGGATVEPAAWPFSGRILKFNNENDSFLHENQLGKTAMDFAEHLLNLKSQSNEPKALNEKQQQSDIIPEEPNEANNAEQPEQLLEATGSEDNGPRSGTQLRDDATPASGSGDAEREEGIGAEGGADGVPTVVGEQGGQEGNRTGGSGIQQDGSGASGDGGDASGSDGVKKPNNFRYDGNDFLSRGTKAKYRDNIEAIRTLNAIEAEGRTSATPEEQAIIAKYVGWGQFPQLFDEWAPSGREWSKERQELKAMIGNDAYDAARSSTRNAHYTNPDIVNAHWKIAEKLGFKGGRYLEPSAGIGYYLGMMPEHLGAKTKTTAVELDPTTGKMLQMLYPGHDVQVKGFQDHKAPDNFYDLAASNVPFAKEGVHDPDYNKHKASLHDYFFLKSLDKVKPGGLLMHITSSGTLDKAQSRIRKELAKKADLVGAIRFPSKAHKDNAGTDVVTDMVILRKRKPGEEPGDQSWTEMSTVPDPDGGAPIPINSYFAQNPHMVLGRVDRTGTMYGEDQANVSHPGDEAYQQMMAKAIDSLPENVLDTSRGTSEPAKRTTASEAGHDKAKENAIVMHDGKPHRVRNGELVPIGDLKDKDGERLSGMAKIRDTMREVIDAERSGGDSETHRKELNKAYDAFVSKHGPLNSAKNKSLFSDDPEAARLLSLEHWDKKSKTATKSAMFSRPTIAPPKARPKPANVQEASRFSLEDHNAIIPEKMAAMLGKTKEQVEKELVETGAAFEEPNGGAWHARDQYLSGNVRKKLKEAEAAAETDPKFKSNVESLRAVIPEDIPHHKITVHPGAAWLPGDVAKDFAAHLMGVEGSRSQRNLEMARNPITGEWHVTKAISPGAAKWETADMGFKDAIDHVLTGTSPTIRVKTESGSIVDPVKTAEARSMIDKIHEEFQKWLWQDDSRREAVGRVYNDTQNTDVKPKFDGSHLSFPGMAEGKRPYDHIANAVHQVLTNNGGLIAHEVGLGKTSGMAASAMEMKRLGLAKKPAILCLNSSLEQVTKEVRDWYPHARVHSSADYPNDAANRRLFASRIATGDHDVVVMSHEQFEKLKLKPETQQKYIEEEIAAVEAALEGGDHSRTVTKQLEKRISTLKESIEKLTEAKQKDDAVSLEETGIDHVIVDEAHHFKNLPVYTKENNLKGIPTSRSARAAHMFAASRHLRDINNGKGGLTFATGTPVTNSLVELYNMQRFIQPDKLEERGIRSFDDWKRLYTQTSSELEPTVKGFETVSRLRRYVNLPELTQATSQNFDYQRAEGKKKKNENGELDDVVKRPKKNVHVIVAEKKPHHDHMMEDIRERMQKVKGKRPGETGENAISLYTLARQGSVDPRMYNPSMPDHPESKTNQMVANVLKIAKENPGKTQMIFSDSGVNPKDVGSPVDTMDDILGDPSELETPEEAGNFHLYGDIINKLVAGGIPRDKIIDFSKVKPADRLIEQERLRDGHAWIGIGGTKKLGTGINAQKKLAALHHLDIPYTPAELEQRNGRAWRSGNENKEVNIFHYVTRGTMDQTSLGILHRKASEINKVLHASVDGPRDSEEANLKAEDMTFDQMMALASGDPFVEKKVAAEHAVKKLESDRDAHFSNIERMRGKIRQNSAGINSLHQKADTHDRHAAIAANHPKDAVELQGRSYEKSGDPQYRAAADEHLSGIQKESQYNWRSKVIGKFAGLNVIAQGGKLSLSDSEELNDDMPATESWTLRGIEGLARRLPEDSKTYRSRADELQKANASMKTELDNPYGKESELDQARKERDAYHNHFAGKAYPEGMGVGDKFTTADNRDGVIVGPHHLPGNFHAEIDGKVVPVSHEELPAAQKEGDVQDGPKEFQLHTGSDEWGTTAMWIETLPHANYPALHELLRYQAGDPASVAYEVGLAVKRNPPRTPSVAKQARFLAEAMSRGV